MAMKLVTQVSRVVDDYLERDDNEAEAIGDHVDLVAEPLAIQAGTAVVLIRLIDAEPPVVRVFSPLLREVRHSLDLVDELNEINAHLSVVRMFWRDGTVFAATELLASSLDGPAFAHACDAVADLADYYDEKLRTRFGGSVAYG